MAITNWHNSDTSSKRMRDNVTLLLVVYMYLALLEDIERRKYLLQMEMSKKQMKQV